MAGELSSQACGMADCGGIEAPRQPFLLQGEGRNSKEQRCDVKQTRHSHPWSDPLGSEDGRGKG